MTATPEPAMASRPPQPPAAFSSADPAAGLGSPESALALPPPESSGAALFAARPSLIRAMNEQLLLEHIRQRGPCSRAELARVSGLSKPTVSLALDNVERAGLVRIAGRDTPTPSHSRSASPTSSATRPRTLVACARSDCLARISPDRSAIAPRT